MDPIQTIKVAPTFAASLADFRVGLDFATLFFSPVWFANCAQHLLHQPAGSTCCPCGSAVKTGLMNRDYSLTWLCEFWRCWQMRACSLESLSARICLPCRNSQIKVKQLTLLMKRHMTWIILSQPCRMTTLATRPRFDKGFGKEISIGIYLEICR